MDNQRRREVASTLARQVGADDLILFIPDQELDVLLPALGFPQTLRQGRVLKALVDAAAEAGDARGDIRHPETGAPVSALAVRAPGSVLLLLGGSPSLPRAQDVCRYLPLVSSALRLERNSVKAEEHAVAALNAAVQARSLARSLDDARRALQRALHEAEYARRRTEFLAETATMLGSSLDYQTTLEAVARLSVGFLADWCFVDVFDDGRTLSRLAVAHADRADEARAAALRSEARDQRSIPATVTKVLGSGSPELVAAVRDPLLEAYLSSEPKSTASNARSRSSICVPLMGRGRVLGCILFVSAPTRRYDQSDLALAMAIAARASLAIENARLYREAQDAIRARNDFLSVAAHELRTPLTPIKLQLQVLELAFRGDLNDLGSERARAKIAGALRQMNRLETLIDHLLDVSRLTAGRLDLCIESVDLCAVIAEVASRFADDLEAAGCTLTVRTPGAVLGEWDRLRLEQVVTNHLSNAIKYGHGNPIEIEVTNTQTTAYLSVRDHGVGISPEDQRRIFGKFERAVSVRNYFGFGLGLWIVRQIVEAFEGTIRVESEVGLGSKFIVALPRQAASVQAERLPKEGYHS